MFSYETVRIPCKIKMITFILYFLNKTKAIIILRGKFMNIHVRNENIVLGYPDVNKLHTAVITLFHKKYSFGHILFQLSNYWHKYPINIRHGKI